MSNKVTIQDIADALGISRNTVSKAINNSDGLAEETRKKILQKAIEMGYKQFSYVQSLYQSVLSDENEITPAVQLGEISLLTTTYFGGSHFATIMLDRFQRELDQLGYRLNAYLVSQADIAARKLPFTFDPQRSKGLICIEMFDWDYDKMLCDLGLPILFVDGPVCEEGIKLPADQLFMDNRTELSRLMHALLKKGIRKIGFMGDYMHCQSFFERYMTFRTTMIMSDVPVDERFVIPTGEVLELYHKLSELDELPELFICANDFVAFDALHILRRLGKSVPDDVMLCGFDDSPESRMMLPTLTTVHIHTQIMAFAATQLLISRIKEPSLDFRRVYTETTLVLRESTGTLLEEASQ